MQNVLDLSLKGDFDALLEYVPDAAVEHALQRKRIFRLSPISLYTTRGAHKVPLQCSVCMAVKIEAEMYETGGARRETLSASQKWLSCHSLGSA